MVINNTLKMEIVKDGKVLKYVQTEDNAFEAGHFTDIYRDDEGKLYYYERITNAIRHSSHSRVSGDGNMISFSITFKNLLLNGLTNCEDKDFDRYILQCDHPLGKAKKFYEKEDAETATEKYLNALEEKISETVTTVSEKYSMESILMVLERALEFPRLKENAPLHNAILLQVYKIKHPEVDDEIEKQ